MVLGSLPNCSLADARDAARQARRQLDAGGDPLDVRDAVRAEARSVEEQRRAQVQADTATLARVARSYHERVVEPNRTAKHAAQWIATLEQHLPDDIWHSPIDRVAAPRLLDALAVVQAKVPETGSRVRQRLEAVFDDAEFRGLCSGNPARAVRKKLTETLARRVRGHFNALPRSEVPTFMAALRERDGVAPRALEFAVLTAARTVEVLGATWDEVDLKAGIWVVPAARMKAGEVHTVFLSEPARAILMELREFKCTTDRVFPSGAAILGETHRAPGLSNMAMLGVLRRMDYVSRTTVHGLCRASFSTWANETGAARPDVIEACLAHREGDRIRGAYNRAAFAKERRELLTAWADYVRSASGDRPIS